jgi:hypothetical protein
MEQLFKTEYNIIFIVIALAISAAISFYYYRQSGLPSGKKKILIAVRTLTIFFILLLLSAPVISYIVSVERNPVNVLLIDNSQSLTLERRDSILKETVKEKFSGLNTQGENIFFTFSDNIFEEIQQEEIDEIQYSGINNFETNLTGTVNSLRNRFMNRNLSSVTIISDGMVNQGGNPLTASLSLGVPFNYILTGDTAQKKDLVVKNVFFNKTAFIESNTPVKIELFSYGYDRDINVSLYENDDFITSKNIPVLSDRNLYEVDFNLSSPSEAVKRYRVEVDVLEGEITGKNNYQEFLIKYVDNKFRVLVLSGGPGPDLAFISGEIKKVSNFETTFRTQKTASEYYEGELPGLSEFDSFIFIGYPTSITNDYLLNDIHEILFNRGSSLFFFSSRNTDYSKLNIFKDILPFEISNPGNTEEETGINIVSQITSESFTEVEKLAPINLFPNIFMNNMDINPKPSSETFIISARTMQPVFLMYNTAFTRSAAFLAYGLYKWRLNKFNLNSEEVLNYLITSTLIKLTDKEKNKAFTIETSKQVYSKYENVLFRAFINPARTDIIKGGERIVVNIKKDNFEQQLTLLKKDNNYFEGFINIAEDGMYDFTAQLLQEEIVIESDFNGFIIDENNFEFKNTRPDNSILSLLQNETGGMNFSNPGKNDIEEFLNELNKRSEEEYRAMRNHPLNINPYYLSGLIILLCLEWFLRKRNNLP